MASGSDVFGSGNCFVLCFCVYEYGVWGIKEYRLYNMSNEKHTPEDLVRTAAF